MKLFLHIQIVEEKPLFNQNISHRLKGTLKGCTFFDVDNHSDPLVVDTATKAIKEAESLFVLVESDQSQPAAVLKLMKIIAGFEKKSPVEIIHNGSNPMLQKLEKGFKTEWLKNVDEPSIERKAMTFFNN